jgi:hypothetical protein
MSGYVAMGRIEGGRVRALAWDGRLPDDDLRAAAEAAELVSLRDRAEPGPDLVEQWGRFRDQLSMTAFFLLDANSWR